jgi:signal transduction histidine kinase
LLIETKPPFLTDTVKKLTLINIVIFFIVLLLFNILLISFVYYILHKNLDQRIEHEIDNIKETLLVSNNSISIIDSSEFKEPDLYEITENPFFLQIYNTKGIILLQSRNIEIYKPIPVNNDLNLDYLTFNSYKYEDVSFRAGYLPIKDSNGTQFATLRLSVFENDFVEVLNELLFFNIWVFLSILMLVVVASIIAAKKTFKPINEIIDTAYSFNVQNLNKRIDVKANSLDEIGRLRDTLNGLFERIEDYVVEITHFSDQVSHQLMNPLTAIRTEIEYLLKKSRPEQEYKEALVKLEGQTDAMINIVKTLLVIAKSGKLKSESKSIFSLSKLIKTDIYEYFKDYNIIYEFDENLYLRGESEKYLMVFQNLIHNSIKYSFDDFEIKVTAKKANGQILISVEDNGIGIDDLEKVNVFQKFYRSQSAEKMGIKGFGLGLSLVKSIVDEASGKIEIADNKPNGTIIKITLPAVELE